MPRAGRGWRQQSRRSQSQEAPGVSPLGPGSRASPRAACRAASRPSRLPSLTRSFAADATMRGAEGLCPFSPPKRLPPSFLRLRGAPAPCSRVPAKPLFPLQPHRSRGPGKQRATRRCFAAKGNRRDGQVHQHQGDRGGKPDGHLSARDGSDRRGDRGGIGGGKGRDALAPQEPRRHGDGAADERGQQDQLPGREHTGVVGHGRRGRLRHWTLGDLQAMGGDGRPGPQGRAGHTRGVLEDYQAE